MRHSRRDFSSGVSVGKIEMQSASSAYTKMIRDVSPPPIESGGRELRIRSGVVPPIKVTHTPFTFSLSRLIV